MTPNQASSLAIAFCVFLFIVIFAFNLGRLTNSTLTVKDDCGRVISHSVPFKGTLP